MQPVTRQMASISVNIFWNFFVHVFILKTSS
jgi:hypothetical protein